jgi:site-specific DNA-cytosine methylase
MFKNSENTKMKYLSLFTGIGGFEVALHRVFPNAECIGYSEVKPHAIKVYEHHFPGH